MSPFNIIPTWRSGGLLGTLLHLTLILFLISGGCCSPIKQSEEPIDSSLTVNMDIPAAGTGQVLANVPSGPPVAATETEPSLFIISSLSTRSQASSRSSSSSFPTAFQSLGNNFTSSSCPDFFSTFLNDTTFQSCHALSPLLQNSDSFFQALSSATTLDQIVDTSCTANITTCATFMNKLASNLTNTANCGSDYQLGNPVVTQAYDSMISYEPIATAACLKDPSTEDFCFTEAATNATNISDYYLYFLPLGNSLPGGSRPTCNQCTQATMQVFQQSAVVKGNPLVNTYIPAAQIIDVACGPGFVNATVDVGTQKSTSSASRSIKGQSPSAVLIYLLTFGGMVLASL